MPALRSRGKTRAQGAVPKRKVKTENGEDGIKKEEKLSGTKEDGEGIKKEDVNDIKTEIKKEAEAYGKELKSPKKRSASTKDSKMKLLDGFGQSPFPSFQAPTHAQAHRILTSLAAAHGGLPQRPLEPPKSADLHAGCGEVPSVLDALIRTILSQNTSDRNSSAAKRSLDAAFSFDPEEKYQMVHAAKEEEVADALRCGGLANIKAHRIKAILQDIAIRRDGKLNLDYMHEKSNREVMEELMSFNGVGPKTASCVLLFCLKRSSFAVDTHVFRLTKALGWIPSKASREQAHMHLDARLPEEIKYPLHILLIREGKRCPRCAAKSRKSDIPCGLRDVKIEPGDVDV